MNLTSFEELMERAGKKVIEYEDAYSHLDNPPKSTKISDATKQVLDNAIKFFTDKMNLAEEFIKILPTYYDKTGLWWIWDFSKRCYINVDEVDIFNRIGWTNNAVNIISSKERTEIINALKQIARLNEPKPISKSWIQFNQEVIDIDTGLRFEATPEYFFVNPLPFKLGYKEETPVLDKLFDEWVGEKWKPTLYEIIAYCLIRDYPIERIFAFFGEGANGKSCFLSIIKKFLGEENITTTDLNILLKSRFETAKLRNKLAVIMGEIDFENINNTQLLKRLVSGKDFISIEYKNKGFLDYVNYAKVLISTNNLPTTDDKTLGFYRRWIIIDFIKTFDEKTDILSLIPEEEYRNLGLKCVGILIELLKKRGFTNEGDYDYRQKRYEEKSNPFDKFFKEFVEEAPDGYIWKEEYEKKLNQWCKENKHRIFSEVAIGKKMKEKGIQQQTKTADWFEDGRIKQSRCWVGLKWKN